MLFVFSCGCFAAWDHLLSVKNSLEYFFKTELLAVLYLVMFLFHLHFLKIALLDMVESALSTSYVSSHYFLVSIISDEMSSVNLIGGSLVRDNSLSFCCFQDSLLLHFTIFVMICLDVDLYAFNYLMLVKLPGSIIYWNMLK